jgi:flagellum-specific peptidoglycan hydrolase FlgJ
MIKKIVFIFILSVLVLSCGSKKRAARKKAEAKKEIVEKSSGVLNDNDVETSTPKINNTTHYISVYKDIAVSEMKKYGIPASITLAQGILESGSGKGTLAVKANNHFGIKCHDWKGAKIYHDDDKRQECFRKYKNSNRSFRDHSEFLSKRGRYASLFKLDKDDYKGWANGLRRAGYATDKRYPQKLISIIERYELYKFDGRISKKKRAKKNIEYTVVKGDTLYSISRKYNITVIELQSINGLKGTEISIGQILNINTREKN